MSIRFGLKIRCEEFVPSLQPLLVVNKLRELKSAQREGKWVVGELGEMILGLSHTRFAKRKGAGGGGEVAIWAWPLGISGEDGLVPGSLGQTYGRLHALEGLARAEEAPW
jgi:hypothetical protein